MSQEYIIRRDIQEAEMVEQCSQKAIIGAYDYTEGLECLELWDNLQRRIHSAISHHTDYHLTALRQQYHAEVSAGTRVYDTLDYEEQVMKGSDSMAGNMGRHDLRNLLLLINTSLKNSQLSQSLPHISIEVLEVAKGILKLAEHGEHVETEEFDVSEMCWDIAKTVYFIGKGEVDVGCRNSVTTSEIIAKKPCVLSAVFTCTLNSLQESSTKLFISSGIKDNGIFIVIEDNGGGVNEEMLYTTDEDLIPPLFREKKSSNKDGGTGKGLYYANKTITELGGTIKATNIYTINNKVEKERDGLRMELWLPYTKTS